MRLVRCILLVICLCLVSNAFTARIKDMAKIAGVRDNQLVGYGLVVGLDGTGDKTNQAPFTDQSFQNMLLGFGVRIPLGKSQQLKNVAAVAISANLPPFAKIGQKIDVTISSLGNATSLRGGSLLMAPLRGADGRVYAMAQGSVVISGFGAAGTDGSKVTVNSLSSGSIPDGATVENCIDTPFIKNGAIIFQLIQPDFTTAERIVRAINNEFGYQIARPIDASAVAVHVMPELMAHSDAANGRDGYLGRGFKGEGGNGPLNEKEFAAVEESIDRGKFVPLISRIENIEFEPAEIGARVIVNSRSGTIVIGRNVTVDPVAVTHGNLSVIVTERPYVSQPGAFSSGKTVKGKASDINVSQQQNRTFVFAPGPSLNDLVEAINAVGAAPGDLISILEAIKAAGALNAELQVI